MTSHRLRAYLELERQMLALDAVGDHLADLLRESMDPLWCGLTEEEIEIVEGSAKAGKT